MTNKWLLLTLSGKCNFLQVIIVSADTNSKLGLIMVSGICRPDLKFSKNIPHLTLINNLDVFIMSIMKMTYYGMIFYSTLLHTETRFTDIN